MKLNLSKFYFLAIILILNSVENYAGPIASGICYAGCAGFTFGTVPAILTVLLVLNPQPTTANPLTIAKTAMTVLGPIVNSFINDLKVKKEAESIKIRVWMHNGDDKLNGCGFYFRVDGYSGGSGEGWFPEYREHVCGESTYQFRMTAQSAMYDKKIRLGNEQAKKIELHADGYHNTFVNVFCIGLNERTIVGGPRAFCINNDILNSCKVLRNQWDDINLNWDDMMFTRTIRGAHKIIFTEIDQLITALDKFNSEPNIEVLHAICNKINLIRGEYLDEYWTCPADKTWTTSSGMGNFYSWKSHKRNENKNPYGCKRSWTGD